MFQFNPVEGSDAFTVTVNTNGTKIGTVRPRQKGDTQFWVPVCNDRNRYCGEELHPSQRNAAMALFLESREEDLSEVANRAWDWSSEAQDRLTSSLEAVEEPSLVLDLRFAVMVLDKTQDVLGEALEAIDLAKKDLEEAQESQIELAEALKTMIDLGKKGQTLDADTLSGYQNLTNVVLKTEAEE